jgi:cytochrome c oxidase subunit 3
MEVQNQKRKIHPHKFTLWVAMGSIVMMFAGFTSAYIVKKHQVNWQGFELPTIFTYSTIVLLAGSVTIQAALKSFRDRRMANYRRLMLITALLGIAFIIMQIVGFGQVQDGGVKMIGRGSNVAGSFLGVIAGMHILHVVGGVVAILVILMKGFRSRVRNYSPVPVEVAATYWHFIDVLWIYLFIFLGVVN